MKNRLQKEVIEAFIRWTIVRIESDKIDQNIGFEKKISEKSEERFLALQIICERANLKEMFEEIKEGRILKPINLLD